MYDTILFDLDGTLTDPGLGITNSVAYALSKWGIEVNDRSFPRQVRITDARYVYRNLPETTEPGGWWGDPFFINTVPSGIPSLLNAAAITSASVSIGSSNG